MRSLPYRPGTLFSVPLRDGGSGLGLVARSAPRGKIVLGYFFGARFTEPPLMESVSHYTADDAILRARFGDLGLLNGEWRVIGDLSPWNKDDWPVPQFVRRDALSKNAWRVTVSEADPSIVVREESLTQEAGHLESVGLYGYGAIELLLTKLLNP